MALPDNALSTTPVQSRLLSPDSRERDSLLADYERGGVALNDPSQGRNVRDWQVFSNGESVWVAPYPEGAPSTLLFTGSGITEVSLSFDGNMQATIAYVEGGVAKLWWFDTIANAMVVTPFVGATSPMVSLDDKRDISSGVNDIILAYIRAGNAYYRQQRDRYNTEYLLGPVPLGGRLVQLGMGENNRLQFKIKYPPSARHADLLTDTLFVLSGEQIVPVGTGDVDEATWRSKAFEAHEQRSPAWVRVDGDYPCTVRVYGDGELATSALITSPAPVRLRAVRAREWQLEVTGSTRVVSVAVAESREELML